MAWNVVIAGGGFGGFYAARTLARSLPPHGTRIRLVSDANFMLYTPLLPGAAAGTLEPRHVVVPLREELHDAIDLRLAHVTGADPARSVLHVTTPTGSDEELSYDHLIVAVGSVSRSLPIPGLAEHAMGFKALSDAIALRNRVLWCLELAETLEDEAERREYLTFVFVGAGYAGLEGLAELQDFAADVMHLYPRSRATGMRWILVEATERVMPEIPTDLAAFAQRELRARGIEIRTSTTLDEAGADFARLSGGDRVPTRTIVWTAGVKPHPVVARLGLPLAPSGRIATDEYLQVAGHDNVWAIGDAAAVPDPARRGGAPSPPTAQHAIRQGRTVGRNVAAALGSGRRRRFSYKTKGVFVDMGRRKAVAQTVGIKWSGTPAWLLARTYHLAMMPGAGRRARLLVDWNINLLFGRDTAELGQLGHPAGLGAPLQARTSADTAADGSRAGAILQGQMSLADTVKQDLATALKAGQKERVGALRLVLSELQKAAKEGDGDELAVLRRERKRRLESAAAFRENGRAELADGEEAEAELIAAYLPAELSDDELRAIVRAAVTESGASSPKDMGQAMKAAMPKVDGRADGKRVSALVREALA